MSNESENLSPQGNEALLRAALKALGSGTGARSSAEGAAGKGGGVALFRALVERAQVRPDQAAVIEMLLAAHGADDETDVHTIETEAQAREYGDAPDETDDASDDVQAMRQELADLREVNDTVAAALGACRVCWGGDRYCDVCGGRGRAGSGAPDLALFEKLVAPAVRRVLRMRQSRRADIYR